MRPEPPLVAEEVIGWRAWQVDGDMRFPLLRSVTHHQTVWHAARWTHATCQGSAVCRKERMPFILDGNGDPQPKPHTIPGRGCTCGLYAAQTRSQLIALGYGVEDEFEGSLAMRVAGTKPVFVGQVGLAGLVIPGDQGWKAEKGRIVKLHVPFHHWRWVEPLREFYRVPVVLDNTQTVDPEWGQEGL